MRNPYTGEREPRLRVAGPWLFVRMDAGEAAAADFAERRGYLPTDGREMRETHWRRREDGSATLRVARADAYEWCALVESDPDAFCACLRRDLAQRIMGAHVVISERWAV